MPEDRTLGRYKIGPIVKPVIRSAIGISRVHVGSRLSVAFGKAEEWFHDMGGKLTHVPIPRVMAVGFIMDPPPIPKVKARAQDDEITRKARIASSDGVEWTPARTEDGSEN